jgi:N-acyl-D-amino-acid deacylase
VHKLTAAPAARIGLTGRGTLAPGKAADIVVFDPAAYRETATLEDPNRLAQGIRHVLINGGISIENGAFTTHRTGQVLRRA